MHPHRSVTSNLRAAALLLALADAAAQAAPVQLNFSGLVGDPTLGFVPAVPTGTAIRYEVVLEDRFSDGDFSDWLEPLGVDGWAEIGTDRYVLSGDRFRFLYTSSFGDKQVSFALTGTGPLTSDGDLFEGLFVSFSSIDGWHGDGQLGYRRTIVGGSSSYGYRDLSGDTTVSAVPEPGSLALALAGLALLAGSTRRPVNPAGRRALRRR